MIADDWDTVSFFTPDELKCKCGKCESDGNEMSVELIKVLDYLRSCIAMPMTINSGYRCLSYQHELNRGIIGAHPLGRAVDIKMPDIDFFISLMASINSNNLLARDNISTRINGIGVYPSKRFIHIDTMTPDEDVTYLNGEQRVFHRPAMWG